MSLIRTQCASCGEPLFWGEHAKSKPECRSCREVREGAVQGHTIVMDDVSIYDAIPTMRKTRYLTT
jgi:endogenous inhibitor of DNA gyrase (YacG/DUF329 family)